MKRFVLAAGLALAMAPATAAQAADPSPTDSKNAAKYCKALKAASGSSFASMFGTKKNAYGKCVSQQAKVKEQKAEQKDDNEQSAAKQCKAESKQSDEEFSGAHGGKTFTQFYGTNKNGKNAFGKCVSSKAKAMNDEQKQEAPATS